MNWVRAAAERLVMAEKELRGAQQALRDGSGFAKTRYANAVRELERAKNFVNRMSQSAEAPLRAGEGLFG